MTALCRNPGSKKPKPLAGWPHIISAVYVTLLDATLWTKSLPSCLLVLLGWLGLLGLVGLLGLPGVLGLLASLPLLCQEPRHLTLLSTKFLLRCCCRVERLGLLASLLLLPLG
jgi:hypothetical protein